MCQYIAGCVLRQRCHHFIPILANTALPLEPDAAKVRSDGVDDVGPLRVRLGEKLVIVHINGSVPV